MKFTQRLVLLMAICFVVPSVKAQINNVDSMVHKIFATLKQKDEQAFVALYPNAQQFSTMMRTVMTATLKSDSVRQLMQQNEQTKNMNVDSLIEAQAGLFANPMMFAQMQKEFGKTFQQIIAKGERKGVNWSAAQLTRYTVDTTGFKPAPQVDLEALGLKNMKGVMDFTSGSAGYQIAFDNVIYLPSGGGWFGGEFIQLARKGESLEPDPETDADAVPVEEEKQQSPATKKTTLSKTQASKTPARKPKAKS